ncbi:FRG domain-containing protein [Bacillus paranthracis]|uniref:FRG domain-containing protein n=1 Tax=Bacillus paranthracis TaxID=2026186 RepID=UPI002812D3D6|nr:FRG domain-containing protein [Bacillus paranthracis]MDR0167400.1 FRG domain-containing protein [Bacillus paranthracis]
MVATQVRQKVFTDEWNQVLEEVAQFRRTSIGNWIWFRGHSDKAYQLDSGIFRNKNTENEKYNLDWYLKVEKRLHVSFTFQASTFVTGDFWDLLFNMQHYGLKTRLLDWTDSFSTALYFAFSEWKYSEGKDACIWLLDPYALNAYLHDSKVVFTAKYFDHFKHNHISDILSSKEDKFENNSFAIYPTKNNPRLLSQNGFFTVQSNQLLSLDEELTKVCPDKKDRIIKKIILSNNLVENVYEYLTINGVSQFTVYNDIEGLCKTLNLELADSYNDERLDKISKFTQNKNFQL